MGRHERIWDAMRGHERQPDARRRNYQYEGAITNMKAQLPDEGGNQKAQLPARASGRGGSCRPP